MQSILIYDTNLACRLYIERIVKDMIISNNWNMDIKVATNSFNIYLNSISTNSNGNIYIINIDVFSKEHLILLNEYIKELDNLAKTIFITQKIENVFSLFKLQREFFYFIEWIDFIDIEKKLDQILNSINKDIDVKGNFLSIKQDKKDKLLKIEDILYITTSDKAHKLQVSMIRDEVIEISDTISNIEKMSTFFLRTHKSFLINKINIKSVDVKNDTIIMEENHRCPISKKFRKKIFCI